MSASQAPFLIKRVTLPDGCALHVELRGTERPVLLIHAGSEDAGGWRPQAEALARKGLMAITYDRRGTRYSGREGWPTDGAPGHAQDAADLLRALDLGSALVVGVSAGALVAIDLALSAPELVDVALVHEPPAFRHIEHGEERFEQLQTVVDQALERDPGDYAGAYACLIEILHGPDAIASMSAERWAMEGANAETFLRDDLPKIARRRYGQDELIAVRHRILLTSGSASAELLHQAAVALEVGGEWSHKILEGEGHTPHLVDPEVFASILARLT